MWQRQIHFAREPPRCSIIASGWASWTITKSYPSSSSLAFSASYRRKTACSGSVSDRGLPWSALWIAFVTWKNSSSPRITRHSASRPASVISGTSVELISATPPPNAVADTWATRLPASGSASRRISPIRPRLAIVP